VTVARESTRLNPATEPPSRMSRTLIVASLWLVLVVALWNGIFDLYVSRGAREYLQLQAEFQLGLGPEPAMAEVMAQATRQGLFGATLWAVLVFAAGMGTLFVARRQAVSRKPQAVGPEP
jgi:hypothetical protein